MLSLHLQESIRTLLALYKYRQLNSLHIFGGLAETVGKTDAKADAKAKAQSMADRAGADTAGAGIFS